jgi:hypothetical protein
MKQSSIKWAILFSVFCFFISCDSKAPNKAVGNKVASTDSLVSIKKTDRKPTPAITTKGDCIAVSHIELPYSKTTDPEKADYQKLKCEIAGIDEFICDKQDQRYIPFPDFENVKVILVPIDCGDFKYRYYLLTLLDNKLVSNKYVEGEWYEPGSEEYKEVTSFSIDADYIIIIVTKSVENGKTSIKETTKVQIRDDGTLDQVN